MRHARVSRSLVSAAIAAGTLVGTGGVLITGATPAFAGTKCTTTAGTANLCVVPTTGVVKKSLLKVIVLTGTAVATPVQIEECVTPGPATVADCNSNTARLGRAGGPVDVTTVVNTAGTDSKAIVEYKVQISATNPVANSTLCAPGGSVAGAPADTTCYIAAFTTGATPTLLASASFVTQ